MTSETILIVEDNNALREGLEEMLGYEGFTALTAENGLKALRLMEAGASPDLILSDITMPEMDGYAFFHAVRARSDWVTIPFIFLTARAEREDVLAGKNLGAEDYLIKPLTREELVTAVRSRLNRARQIQVAQLKQAYQASLTALANAIEVRDRYTRYHVERVTAYALVLAEQLKWPDWKREQLMFGAILHDIGKIHISDSTLKKTTPLNEEEWSEIQRHPINGAEMIANIPYLAPAVPIVRSHHERWDGSGYPDGLAGEEIPAGARLVSIADSFDAMTTMRPYSTVRSLEDGLQEIIACSGTIYDPGAVEAWKAAWEAGEVRAVVEMWQQSSVREQRSPYLHFLG